jgi:hypothetical protein
LPVLPIFLENLSSIGKIEAIWSRGLKHSSFHHRLFMFMALLLVEVKKKVFLQVIIDIFRLILQILIELMLVKKTA